MQGKQKREDQAPDGAGRKPFQVRVSQEEKLELEMAAQRIGLGTSTWMRITCLAQARKPAPVPVMD